VPPDDDLVGVVFIGRSVGTNERRACGGSAQVHEDGGEPAGSAAPVDPLDAIDRQPSSSHSPLLFPAERGGYLDLHNFRLRVLGHRPSRRRLSADLGEHAEVPREGGFADAVQWSEVVVRSRLLGDQAESAQACVISESA
jgi:hypothetical protein